MSSGTAASVSLQQCPSPPETNLTITSVTIHEPSTLPVVSYNPKQRLIVTIEEEKTVVDQKGGEQTVYCGFLQRHEQTLAEFQLRANSNLLAVWNFNHARDCRNYLHIKTELDCIEHYPIGPSRDEIWSFAKNHRAKEEDLLVRKMQGEKLESETIPGSDVNDIDTSDVSLDQCLLSFEFCSEAVVWYTTSNFAVPDCATELSDVLLLIEAWEANMPMNRSTRES